MPRDGDQLTYLWDFTDDGLTDNAGREVTHVFPEAGTYFVDLTVFDPQGWSTRTSSTVRVRSSGPSREERGPRENSGDGDFQGPVSIALLAGMDSVGLETGISGYGLGGFFRFPTPPPTREFDGWPFMSSGPEIGAYFSYSTKLAERFKVGTGLGAAFQTFETQPATGPLAYQLPFGVEPVPEYKTQIYPLALVRVGASLGPVWLTAGWDNRRKWLFGLCFQF